MTLRQKLERKGVTLTPKLAFESTTPLDTETLALLKAHKDDLLRELIALGRIPRLPWQLERLVSAASTGVLPETVMLSAGLIPDLNRYVLGWGCSYLVSDRTEAERRLWQVYEVWKGTA